MTPHKHAVVIKAWADGAHIQEYQKWSGKWQDVGVAGAAILFSNSSDYRVKPQAVKYRRCVCKGTGGSPWILSFNDGFGQKPEDMEKMGYFIRWIDTEWQEVEI